MRILNVTTVAIASLDGKTPQDLPNDVKKSIERLIRYGRKTQLERITLSHKIPLTISDLQAIEALLEATRAKVKKGFWQKLRANPKVKPAQLISQCSSKLSWALSTFNVGRFGKMYFVDLAHLAFLGGIRDSLPHKHWKNFLDDGRKPDEHYDCH